MPAAARIEFPQTNYECGRAQLCTASGISSERNTARTTRLKRLFPIALNVDAAAAALSCSAQILKDAAHQGRRRRGGTETL
jgi:hypothetical protein